MLVPKLRLHTEGEPNNRHCTCKYCVYDTEKKGFVESRVFSFYETEQECQEAIDWFNDLDVIKVL